LSCTDGVFGTYNAGDNPQLLPQLDAIAVKLPGRAGSAGQNAPTR
jgi:hypothetical protein